MVSGKSTGSQWGSVSVISGGKCQWSGAGGNIASVQWGRVSVVIGGVFQCSVEGKEAPSVSGRERQR